jgi:ureidoglycolate lyase
MRKIKLQQLSLERFNKFGAYSRMIDPDACKIGQEPTEFFRDMITMGTVKEATSFSVFRASQRRRIIDGIEYHTFASEAMMPIDGDVILYFAPATPNGIIPLDGFEAFLVPKGTMVVARPGVWHCGAFTACAGPVNVLIVLPERAYANDCVFIPLKIEEQIEIVD